MSTVPNTYKEELGKVTETTQSTYKEVDNLVGTTQSTYKEVENLVGTTPIGQTTTTTGTTLSAEEYELIVRACNMIKDTASDMQTIGRKINSAGEYCTPNYFYVDGYSYSDNVNECSNCFQFASKGLDEYADSILQSVNKAFNMEEQDSRSGSGGSSSSGGQQQPPGPPGEGPPGEGPPR